MENEDAKKFMELYDKWPFTKRSYPIVVVDGRVISWTTAHTEITKGSDFGKRILMRLKEEKIIK